MTRLLSLLIDLGVAIQRMPEGEHKNRLSKCFRAVIDEALRLAREEED